MSSESSESLSRPTDGRGFFLEGGGEGDGDVRGSEDARDEAIAIVAGVEVVVVVAVDEDVRTGCVLFGVERKVT